MTNAKSDVTSNEIWIKKSVKWHDKKSGNKRVVINKNDLDIDVGEDVYIFTFNQMQILDNKISEYETKINNLESDLKEANDESSSKSDVEIHQLEETHQKEITQLKEIHQKEIDALKDEIDQLKQKHYDEISTIKADHQDDIKEYQVGHQKALEQNERLLDEVKMANAQAFDYASKYNQLRQEVINLSRWDAIRNRHKQIPIDYPLIQLSSDAVAIDIKPTKND